MHSPDMLGWSSMHNNMPTPIPHDSIGFEGLQESSTLQHSNGEASHNSFAQFFNPVPNQPNDLATHHTSSADAMILDDQPTEENTGRLASIPESSERPSKRSKYRHLDWDGNQDRLRQLYLEEGKSLTETMQIMKNEHGFDAS
jgi:Clr5 domain